MADIEYSTNWATIIYDSTRLKDLREYCNKFGLSCVISPYHNKEYDDNGNKKKDHYHVLFIFRSKKSRNQVNILFGEIGGVGAEHIYNVELYYHYLWHDEAFDKVQYDRNDLQFINCGESNFVNETSIYYIIKDLIIDECITTFTELFKVIEDYYFRDSKIVKVIRNNSFIYKQLMNDNQFKKKKNNEKNEEKEDETNGT